MGGYYSGFSLPLYIYIIYIIIEKGKKNFIDDVFLYVGKHRRSRPPSDIRGGHFYYRDFVTVYNFL
jgi:hypothetical protein